MQARWLDQHWSRLDSPVLFVASENPADAEAFRDYNPVTLADLGGEILKAPQDAYNYLRCDLVNPTPVTLNWFIDWWLLICCDVLVFGESTFAFTAAMLGHCREAWRSVLSKQAFVRINPWDSYPLVREDLRDYPDIPGTAYPDNPLFKGHTAAEVMPRV